MDSMNTTPTRTMNRLCAHENQANSWNLFNDRDRRENTPILVTFEDTPSQRSYIQRPRSYALALAPAIHMALRTRDIDDGKQTSPPPSIDAIERWIVSKFPSHLRCDYHDIFWGITKRVYPPVRFQKFSDPTKAHEVLRAGRPVLVSMALRWQEWDLSTRFEGHNNQNKIFTRNLYKRQPEDTSWGPFEHHAVLWTGYDPRTGVCTFVDPYMYKTKDGRGYTRINYTFKVQDIDLLTTTMPMSRLTFYDFHCHPGKVIKHNKFDVALRFLFGRGVLPAGQSLAPNPFAEYQKKKKKHRRPKNNFWWLACQSEYANHTDHTHHRHEQEEAGPITTTHHVYNMDLRSINYTVYHHT